MPYLNLRTPSGRSEFEGLVREIVGRGGTFVYNDADWGLGDHALEEHVIQ